MGLSMILGGCGVRLDEANFYFIPPLPTMVRTPLKYTMPLNAKDGKQIPAKEEAGITVMSPSANYMLTRILSELHGPDLPNAFDEAQGIPHIAWKTGLHMDGRMHGV
jgi:penicillin-binding protein 1C